MVISFLQNITIYRGVTAVKMYVSTAPGNLKKESRPIRQLVNFCKKMEIEKEIQNAKFKDNYQKVSVNIIYTYNWLNSVIKAELAKSKITPQQFNILRILRGQHPKPATVNIIKERMLDKMSDASRIVDRLVSKGLVTRTVCESDRRAVDILISDKGLALLAGVKLEEAMAAKFKNNISDEQAAQLSELLDIFRG